MGLNKVDYALGIFLVSIVIIAIAIIIAPDSRYTSR